MVIVTEELRARVVLLTDVELANPPEVFLLPPPLPPPNHIEVLTGISQFRVIGFVDPLAFRFARVLTVILVPSRTTTCSRTTVSMSS